MISKMPKLQTAPKVFLSIDIDFWMKEDPAIIGVAKVLRFADWRRIPLTVVMNHQQMLPLANESSARIMINVDQHSDLCDRNIDELNCGTWVAYVKWRKEGTYIWARNSQTFDNGNCNWHGQWNENHDWKEASSKHLPQDFDINSLLTSGVVGIGICLSPSYTEQAVYDAVRPLLKGRPYHKGKLDELTLRRKCTPPQLVSLS